MLSKDHPDPPFAITFQDIGQDSLIINWNPPAWDGGSNITNYLIEKREIPMSSWIRVGNTRYYNLTQFFYFHQIISNFIVFKDSLRQLLIA